MDDHEFVFGMNGKIHDERVNDRYMDQEIEVFVTLEQLPKLKRVVSRAFIYGVQSLKDLGPKALKIRFLDDLIDLLSYSP